MPSCLGIYIESKLIKYAKVEIEKDKTKIDNFGVEFYEDLPKTIAQIIEETSSEKTPISINISDEAYDYFKIFSLLAKKDLEKAIATEVETIYFEKGLNKSTLESRYILSNIADESDRLRVLNISASKAEIMGRSNVVGKGKLQNVTPVPVALPEIMRIKEKENSLIINMEEKTVFTSIIDGHIYEVEKSNYGMSQILEKINFKENSYYKGYQICKNTTIFTSDIADIDGDGNLYLQDIMPTLYDIVQDMNKIIEKLPKRISKVYLTGSAALINNIDLYFKEYLEGIECVILKPAFLDETNQKINIKDYIEVNSAIALAVTALKEKTFNINFLGKGTVKSKNTSSANKIKASINLPKFDVDLKGPLDKIDISLIRGAVSVFLIFVIYVGISSLLTNSINAKNEEISKVTTSVNQQIELAKKDLNKLQEKVSTYQTLKENLSSINEKISESNKAKNSIPNLLTNIMNVVSSDVTILSIENIDNQIIINAQSNKYDSLAYFTAALRTQGILSDVQLGLAKQESLEYFRAYTNDNEVYIELDADERVDTINVTIKGNLKGD